MSEKDLSKEKDLPGIAHGRILEVEVMDEPDEVEAYLDGVATAHLDRMDDTFVAAALAKLRVSAGGGRGRRKKRSALDVGTGTGALPVKMALREPGLSIVGVDMAPTMLREARARARAAGVSDRVAFRKANGRRLPFPDRSFDLVVCNSVLHHIPDPAPLLEEMARVLRRGGALFVRDLRRPHPRLIERHIRHHGRHYSGVMYRLFADSVRAALTESELRQVVSRTAFGPGRRGRGGPRGHRARVRRMLETYLVVEAP